MNIAYCMEFLHPAGGWTTGDTPESIRMLDGPAPPSLDELQTVWAARETALAAAAAVKQKLAAVMETFTAGQRVAYAGAVDAVSTALDDADTATARDIIATFPAVDEALRTQLMACF